MVWKFKEPEDFEEEEEMLAKNQRAKLNYSEENRIQADMALFSFVKILAKINKLSPILAYRKNPQL